MVLPGRAAPPAVLGEVRDKFLVVVFAEQAQQAA
jgi:hypothetical protein